MATCSEVFKNEEFDFSNEPVVNWKRTIRKVLKALAEYRKCKRELSEVVELPPLNTLTRCLKWGIPANTDVSTSYLSRLCP
ncbi:hypothetical protein ACQVQY_32600 [Bacillus mycoides]|uniref:hypothetical protein n=1 Tax=Bacillus mycoides TaxID=1405 RepID=UPI003D662830